MKHRRISQALTAAGALATLGGLFLFFAVAPIALRALCDVFPEQAGLYWPCLLMAWIVCAVYLIAMVLYFRIVARIGKNQSFCAANARDMGRIACCMGAAGILWVLIPLLLLLIWGVGLGVTWIRFVLAALASFAMGILAWGLARLLQGAVSLKEENDLTV